MNSFKDIKLKDCLIDGLKKDNITEPRKIQSQMIEIFMEGKDIIAQSKTGSGKTLAYLLPIVNKINTDEKKLQAIVITPTHELSVQVNNEIKKLAKNSNLQIRSSLLIGGVNIKRQVNDLKNKPHIVVGSTGRMLELIKLKKLKPHTVKTIVIDEADRMINDNSIIQTKALIKTTLRDRQLVMLSATMPDDIVNIATEMMKEPELIFVDENLINKNVNHFYLEVERRDKIDMLRKLIRSINPHKAIVFVNRNEIIQDVVNKLNFHKLKTAGLFGAQEKLDRQKSIVNFKNGKANILIASDIAARGLDIKGVTHIINLDLPEKTDEYLHRIGRTGREKEKGIAISLATEYEVGYLHRIQHEYDIKIGIRILSKGNLIGKSSNENKRAKNSKKR
ncbi:DEAD/DEAH box helicase [Clostridiaceae bacterium HSG29]|nr:DEAD/DEAH box helicase [Clostridiaceae bacterium HSG29]